MSGICESKKSKPKKIAPEAESRSLPLANRGPRTVMEIGELTLAIACDVIRGAVTAGAANASSSNVGKTLKAYELQLKYGPKGSNSILALK